MSRSHTSFTFARVARSIVALLAVVVSLTLGTAVAAVATPVTSTITGPFAATPGTLANGVTWTRDSLTGWHCDTRTFTFDHPVDVEFGINSLNAAPDEGVLVPVGTQPVSISPSHSWDPATRTVAVGTPVDENAMSTFKLDNITSLALTGVGTPGGSCLANRNLAFIDVTYDNALPTVTVNGPADGATYQIGDVVNADFTCADDLAVTSCVGDQPNGSVIDTSVAGTSTFTVVATDSSGETTSKTVTYTVAPVVGVSMINGPVAGGAALLVLIIAGGVFVARRRIVPGH